MRMNTIMPTVLVNISASGTNEGLWNLAEDRRFLIALFLPEQLNRFLLLNGFISYFNLSISEFIGEELKIAKAS